MWRVAQSLLVLHAQLKAGSRAAPPATPYSAWGTIGDAAHDPTSDHTPHDFPGWGTQIVTAADFPNAPALGLDAHRVLDDIRRARDQRVKYGISNGQMYSSYAATRDGVYYAPYTWRAYTGSDGHFDHGHLSVVGDVRADGTQPWQTIGIGDFEMDAVQAQQLANVHQLLQALVRLQPIATGVVIQGYSDAANRAEVPLAVQAVELRTAVTALSAAVGQAVVTDAQIEVIAQRAAAAVVARDDNPLSEADVPVLVEAFKQAAREGTGIGG